jgi:hypothetical protein
MQGNAKQVSDHTKQLQQTVPNKHVVSWHPLHVQVVKRNQTLAASAQPAPSRLASHVTAASPAALATPALLGPSRSRIATQLISAPQAQVRCLFLPYVVGSMVCLESRTCCCGQLPILQLEACSGTSSTECDVARHAASAVSHVKSSTGCTTGTTTPAVSRFADWKYCVVVIIPAEVPKGEAGASKQECSCKPGFGSPTGEGICRLCPTASYSPGGTMEDCKPCPFGFTSRPGARGVEECVPIPQSCPVGQVALIGAVSSEQCVCLPGHGGELLGCLESLSLVNAVKAEVYSRCAAGLDCATG